MAPIRPKPHSNLTPTIESPNSQPKSKKSLTKRITKRAKLLHRLQQPHSSSTSTTPKTAASTRISKSSHRPRRPAKKLKGAASDDLSTLVASLPTLNPSSSAPSPSSATKDNRSRSSTQKLSADRSLGSKPRVQRKLERVAKLERERFGQNLAAMVPGVSERGTEGKIGSGEAWEQEARRGERWAALRRQINASLGRQE